MKPTTGSSISHQDAQEAQQQGRLGENSSRLSGLPTTPTPGTESSMRARPWWHVYDIGGRGTETPLKRSASDSREQLAGKHRRKASCSLGILAHLLGDLANPMHTDQTNQRGGHPLSHEEAVDRRSGKRDTIYKFHYDGRDSGSPVTRPSMSPECPTALTRDWCAIMTARIQRRVHRITKRQLNRRPMRSPMSLPR